jgi:Protein of unknown function (DUF3224)
MNARGSFEVKLSPQPLSFDGGAQLARMTLDKVFHGDLEGTSAGEMLSAGSAARSGAYVAIERVDGTLAGRRGTFILQHSATMNRGTPSLLITVVPDSATGELEGLSGTLMIIIEEGKHSYDFEYTLP